MDLTETSKPVPTSEIVTDAKAAAKYDSDVEAWGEGLQRQIRRLCWWAKDTGWKDLECVDPKADSFGKVKP